MADKKEAKKEDKKEVKKVAKKAPQWLIDKLVVNRGWSEEKIQKYLERHPEQLE